MTSQQRIVERPPLGGNDQLSPPNRMATLELVERDSDAGIVEPCERPFDAAIGHQAGEPFGRDPSVFQQGQIRAGGMAVDAAPHQLEEHALSIAQPVLERDPAGLTVRSLLAKEPRKAGQQPRSHQALVDECAPDPHESEENSRPR